jgi:hypothetical protein
MGSGRKKLASGRISGGYMDGERGEGISGCKETK